MAPETAGSGASLEWRSVETAPEPKGLFSSPLLGKAMSSASPATSPSPTAIFARTHTHTHMPPRSQISSYTHALTSRMHVHAGSHTHARADVRRLAASFLASRSSHVEWQVCTSIVCGRSCYPGADQGGRDALGRWTNLRWCLCFQILFSASLPSRPFSRSSLHCVSFSVHSAFF